MLDGLVDTGATGYAFVDTGTAERICKAEGIAALPLSRIKPLKAFDGRLADPITHAIFPRLQIGDHTEDLCPMMITKLGSHPLILGKPWMRKHGIMIDMSTEKINFKKGHCTHPGVEQAATLNEKRTIESTSQEFSKTKEPASEWHPKILKRQSRSEAAVAPATLKPVCNENSQSKRKTLTSDTASEPKRQAKAIEILQIGAAPFHLLSKQKDAECFSISLKDIQDHQERQQAKEVDPLDVLPKEYHDLVNVFSKKHADELPPHRDLDHKIVLQEEAKPGYCPLYNMSQEELVVVKEYLREHLNKGFIRASTSPFASPVLFVRKPGGGLRFCVDYRKLNALTRKDRYPLPLIEETLAQLSEAKIFTKLDIRHAFNRIRLATEKDEDLTTFRTRFGSYKYLVLPFGLTNGPATFQHFINDTLFDYLNIFCTAYLDDVLIYSQNSTEHQLHVRKVLQRLQEAGLQVDIKKCDFGVTETRYLGLIVTTKGIKMDPEKVRAIQEWETPTNLRDVQAFVGFVNFYRRFIRNFSKIARPLTALSKKDLKFEWTPECQVAFELLKKTVVEAPVLKHFDRTKQCFVETDSSDYVSSGVFSQKDENEVPHPVAFFSKKLVPAECNYEIYDKELLAIIRCFEQWRPELEGTDLPIQVLTDHKSLEYFMTTKKLTRRQARWAEFLANYNFQIVYRPGKKNGQADSLTRRPGDRPNSDEDDRQKQQLQTLLNPSRLSIAETLLLAEQNEERVDGNQSEQNEPNLELHQPIPIVERVRHGHEEDEFVRKVLRMLREGQRHSKEISLPHCEEKDECLYFREKLWVPEAKDLRRVLIKEIHESPEVGHAGLGRTLKMIKRNYYWPRMDRTCSRYLRNCHTCRRSKAPRDTYNGILNPLPIPERPWQEITMDFVTGLPECEGKNAILVVVDRLTKMRHLIACTADGEGGTSAEKTADMIMRHVWKHHGLFDCAVSDRGTQFISEVWQHLCRMLKITSKLSTAYHPETDGQSEIVNSEMERYLRSYVNYQQDDWVQWLHMAEFAANNSESATTRVSPFFANFGFHPRMSFDAHPPAPAVAPRDRSLRETAESLATKMKNLQEYLQEQMGLAQTRMEGYANEDRIPAPKYAVNDKVWLSTKNIRTARPSKKLDHKQEGPFSIVKKIGASSYQLALPASMKIHPVFHSSLLRLDQNDPLPNQIPEPPPPVIVEGENEWNVEEILDSRYYYGRLQYKAQWTDHAPDSTWYNADGFENAKELVDAYHARYPNKPAPRREGLRSTPELTRPRNNRRSGARRS